MRYYFILTEIIPHGMTISFSIEANTATVSPIMAARLHAKELFEGKNIMDYWTIERDYKTEQACYEANELSRKKAK